MKENKEKPPSGLKELVTKLIIVVLCLKILKEIVELTSTVIIV